MAGRAGFELGRGLALLALLSALGLGCPRAQAQDSIPASERPAHVESGSVSVRVLGSVVSRDGRLGSRRAEARRQALGRGKHALHVWLDDELAQRGTSPALATQLHAVIDRDARVLAEQPLVDGSIVLVVALPLALLQQAGAPELEGATP